MLQCDGGKWPHFDVKSLESRTQESAGTVVPSLVLPLYAHFHLKVIIYSLLTHATANYVQASVTNVTTG